MEQTMTKMADEMGARVMAYECRTVMADLVAALHEQCSDGEKVIWRAPFRWKDHSGILSNQYEMFEVDSVADAIGCEVVWDFRHAAIVRPKVQP
jgi:hypothetical protein